MLTWKLARAMIDTHYNHPLYQRVNLQAWYNTGNDQMLERLYIMFGLTALVAVALIFGAVYSLLLLHGIIFLPFISIFFGGIALAPGISRTIIRVQEEGAYDLLCMTPGGAIHINWLIATGFIHHAAQRPSKIHGVGAWVKLIGWLVLSGTLLWLTGLGQIPFLRVIYGVMIMVAVVAIFVYVNNVQSLLLAGLVGMLIPTYVQRSYDAHFWALTSIITIQIVTYTLTTIVLIGFNLWLGRRPLLAIIASIAVLTLATLYVLREIVIAGLWYLLLRRLQVTAHDVQFVIPA